MKRIKKFFSVVLGLTMVANLGVINVKAADLPYTVEKVYAGNGVSFALTDDGDLYALGTNGRGQLGSEDAGYEVDIWTKVYSNVKDVFLGSEDVNFLIDKNSNLYSTGYNEYGELGTGDTELGIIGQKF